MSSSEKNDDDTEADPVESETKFIRKEDYRLDTVNGYGDNLLHLSAANNCHDVIEEIFNIHGCKDIINSKNDCGWTPLMQAIRNGNIETVKFLLANGCRPAVSSSKMEDVSAIGLAAAMGFAMFEVVYNACPSALEDAKHDSIGPLCVAAMKGDKELFFGLLELGLKVSEVNEYTRAMMRQSRIPEIAKLADIRNDFEDIWNNESMEDFDFPDDEFETPRMSSTLDNIDNSLSADLSNESSKNFSSNSEVPSIRIIPPADEATLFTRRNTKKPRVVDLLPRIDELSSRGSVSPALPFTRRQNFPISPGARLTRRKENDDDSGTSPIQHNIDNDKRTMHKYKLNRPPDLEIFEDNVRGSEYFLEELNDVDRGCKTPIGPPYATPPPGMILDADQTKIALLLKRFGLTHMINIFLEQEVDLDLFLTLSDRDLQEIGIEKKSDRHVLLSVIGECNRYRM